MTMPGPSTATGREKQVPAAITNLDAVLEEHWSVLTSLFVQLECVRESRPEEADAAPDQPRGSKIHDRIEQQIRKVAMMTKAVQQNINELEV